MSSRAKLLVVLTSQDVLPTRDNIKTGWYLPEFVYSYNALAPHVDLVIASPKGGEAPIDPYSIEDSKEDKECQTFLDEKSHLWENTEKLENIIGKTSDFVGIFFVATFDLVIDTKSHALVREFWESGKIVSAVCYGPRALVNIKLLNGEYLIKGHEFTGFSNSIAPRSNKSNTAFVFDYLAR
ncbi:hypothetical protein ACHAQH_007733 [Verticillium albo-atrum]